MRGYESLVVRKEQNVSSFKKVRARGRKRLAFGWFVCSNNSLYTQLIISLFILFAICQRNQTQRVLYFSLAWFCHGLGVRFGLGF